MLTRRERAESEPDRSKAVSDASICWPSVRDPAAPRTGAAPPRRSDARCRDLDTAVQHDGDLLQEDVATLDGERPGGGHDGR